MEESSASAEQIRTRLFIVTAILLIGSVVVYYLHGFSNTFWAIAVGTGGAILFSLVSLLRK